jgi:hypothetical protein
MPRKDELLMFAEPQDLSLRKNPSMARVGVLVGCLLAADP